MTPDSGSLEALLESSVRDLADDDTERVISRIASSEAPDDLALEFDDVYTAYVDRLDSLPPEGRLETLQALDRALTAMSGPANAALWTAPAVRSDPRWREIRELANQVLDTFAWVVAR